MSGEGVRYRTIVADPPWDYGVDSRRWMPTCGARADGHIVNWHRQYDDLARAEARAAAATEALRQIAERHPDAATGEHPAVDIARDALASAGAQQEPPPPLSPDVCGDKT